MKRKINKLKIKWKNSLLRRILKQKGEIRHLKELLEETKKQNHYLVDQKNLDELKIRELMLEVSKKAILILVLALFIPTVNAKTYSKNECKQYALQQVINRGWTIKDYNNLVKLWNKESNWKATTVNKRSGACGIPQANPCKKMKKYGKDYKTNCKVQIKWGLVYIKSRYKTPTKAWQFFQRKHWY